MTIKKIISLAILTLGIIVLVLVIPDLAVAASPDLQMTPGVDPMSVPTTTAPTELPGTNLDGSGSVTNQTNCPMLTGTTGYDQSQMSGMGGMGMMSGMNAMGGMGGMSGMGSMSGMGGMSGMGSMQMGSNSNVNDMLSARGNWFERTNPWWLLGWLVLALLFIVIVVGAVLLLVRLFRRDKQPVIN